MEYKHYWMFRNYIGIWFHCTDWMLTVMKKQNQRLRNLHFWDHKAISYFDRCRPSCWSQRTRRRHTTQNIKSCGQKYMMTVTPNSKLLDNDYYHLPWVYIHPVCPQYYAIAYEINKSEITSKFPSLYYYITGHRQKYYIRGVEKSNSLHNFSRLPR